MKNDKPVLIDTSIWIDYFKHPTQELAKTVDDLLLTNRVVIPKVVLAELYHGAHSQKEISLLEIFFSKLSPIDHQEKSWERAGKLAFEIRKKGKTLSLIDCYITIIAKDHNCAIYTKDKHFTTIRAFYEFDLM